MDGFGHINNTVYYNFMDDAINMHLIDRGIGREYPRFIAENGIKFKKPIKFPSSVHVGLQVISLGSSSVTYDVGFYEGHHDQNQLAAIGKFVHVYVNEVTGRPQSIPEEARRVLGLLVVERSP
jgi:acyl-CoA thioester hydrolase